MKGLEGISNYREYKFNTRFKQRLGDSVAWLKTDRRSDKPIIKLGMKPGCTDEDLLGVVKKLTSNKCIGLVETIGLNYSHITGAGIDLLMNFPNLKDLELRYCLKIRGNGFNGLKNVKKLVSLELFGNKQIEEAGVESLSFVNELPHLSYVDLQMTGITRLEKWTDIKEEFKANHARIVLFV